MKCYEVQNLPQLYNILQTHLSWFIASLEKVFIKCV